jgi:hypothetical protein
MAAGQAAWRVEQVRCTAFPSTAMDVRRGVWERLVGEPPETVTDKPRAQLLTELGPFQAGQLQYSATPIRVDWRYTTRIAAQVDELDEVNFDGMGELSDGLGALDKVINGWFGSAPPLSRLALGAVLHHPVEDKAAAHRALNGLLSGVNIPEEGASDFLYQINRPRESGAENGLVLNRLSKWSVAGMLMQLQTEGQTKTVVLKTPLVACRLELDVNTAAEREEPISDVQAVWRELSGLALEIAEKGDVP